MPNTVLRKQSGVNTLFSVLRIFIAALVLAAPIQAQQSQRATQPESPKAEASVSPPAVSLGSPGKNAGIQKPESPVQKPEGGEQETSGSGKPVTRAEWMQIGISALLFIVVLWQTLIYVQQRNIMRTQINQAKVSERAYLGIKDVITENQVIDAVPVVRLTLINGGRTPAYGLKVPGHLTITKNGLPFPHERPEVSQKESSTFLPAGNWITYNYPFTFRLTPEWARAIESEKYLVFLHVEAHFSDVWGDTQVMPFKLAYRAEDRRWGNYKERDHTDPKIEIS